ncbi:MAG: DUF4157 domain-containing protein [Solirubrobacteraceae bacterium]
MTRKRDRRRQREDEAQGPARPDEVKHLTEQIASAEALDAPSIRTLQRTAGNQAVTRLGPGKPLDPATRGRMESAFQTSFADVRVHSGPESAALARGEDAAAFAVGNEIVLGEQAGAPGTVAGDALLAHELAHVAQQRGAEETVQAKSLGAAAGGALERDADRSALKALSALWGNVKQNAMPALKSGVQLSRCPQKIESVNERAGDTESGQIKVAIDSATRPVQGGPPEISGSGRGCRERHRRAPLHGGGRQLPDHQCHRSQLPGPRPQREVQVQAPVDELVRGHRQVDHGEGRRRHELRLRLCAGRAGRLGRQAQGQVSA